MRIPQLETENLYFRIVTSDDYDVLFEQNWNLDIEQISGGIFPYNRGEFDEFIDKHLNDGNYTFMVILKENDEIIGSAGISDFYMRDGRCEIDLTIFDKNNHRKGYGTEILSLLEKFAFYYLSMRKVQATIYGNNIASQKLFEKNNYKQVGCYKEHRMFRGKYYDTLVYEKFRENEFENMFG